MGTGDYMCVTLRGGAPWGFTLREGEGDTYTPFIVSQVDEGGRAFLAGVREGDEVVSLNGEPCADLTLLRAFALIDTSIDCLQLLVKRYCSIPPEDYESEETYCGERDSSGEALKSTTLHIFSPKHRSQSPRELYISESHDEDYYGEFPKAPQLLYTQLHAPSSGDLGGQESAFKGNDEEAQRCFSPGNMVELQVSLSEQTLDGIGCSSLGSALGIEGELSNREAVETIHTTTASRYVPCSVREPLGQRGVVLSSPSMLGQVEVILQQQAASGAGRGILSVGGPRVSGSVGSQSEGEEGGGHCEGVPGSFTVSFGIPSEEATPAEEQGSDSEGDPDKPNKHRARHARLRRSESLSEKHVKEAKSKCKRIALLLTAAPPNPNNKGVLMFKKHRQRAKKFTLVSYGTGEDEPDFSDEDDDENEETHTVEFTLVAPDGSEINKHFLTNAHSSKGVLTINWDKGLLEIERNLNNQAEMECLPETKGKGAVMFAQRRLRMDEISAEHDELRRQGIPVEAVPMVEKKIEEHSHMQSTTEGHAYMDVNIHQQSQQQQQYQQYQEQQYYEQQQNYQQQQYQQQYQQQQQQQQQQYEQQHYQQQQMYQQQQAYHQEQQQMQHYSTNINGTVQHQTSEMQSSYNNRTAKPFSGEIMPTTPYSPAMSGTNQDSVGQGEQIASRDERISVPASRTGVLSDSKRRNAGKPMFTFKEAPKVSPNPALLNLLNRKDKKLGFESGPEEDYLSLGAEACNFLQSQGVKHKTPPPVAPKPLINPNSPPWSPQIEVTNQDMPQQAENSVFTPAVAPTMETTPAPELEPAPAPAPEPSPPPAPQETPASTTAEEQHTWTAPQPVTQQQPLQVTAQEENGHMNSTLQPEPAPVTSWAPAQAQPQPSPNSWHPAQVQPQEPPQSQSPSQPPWMTPQPTQTQAQPQPPTNTWTPQIQPSWSQPQEQAQAPTHAQPPWTQPQEQPQSHPQVQPPWAHSHEQPNLQQMQPTWGQPQEPMQQQPQAPWAQPSQTDSQQQPPWMQQPQQKSQAQPPWAQQVQPESQPQPPWVQEPQHQAPQQAWSQAQAPEQPQPPWASAQPQQQQQPSINAWPPSQAQAQVQPPWIQAAPAQPPAQPQAILNPWAPVPAQAQSQQSWAQHPSEHGQHPINSWAQEQNQAQPQPPWAQPVPPQPTPQPNWQQPTSKTPPQPPMNTWPSPQTQPQTPVNAWAPQSQQTPVNVPTSMVNTRPSPKPWHPPQNAPQNQTPPPPPQRMHSFTIGQRSSSPINPMASVLNPSSQGSAFEMPAVRGKGADMFAKRQSRMEKFVVDSETVQANQAIRSTSPVASLPNEWKYTPNVRAPPSRAYNPIQSPSYPPAATKQPPPSSPLTKANKKDKEKQKPARKLNVIDVMKHQPYQLNSTLFTFGPAVEAAKPPEPKPDCPPPKPPVENQPIRYEQMAPVQPAGPYNAPYPQQPYGMPMQPMMHDGHYQQNPANVYPPPNPYQQPPGGPYQQAYNQQYQQPAPPAYHPQAPQSPNSPYQQAPQGPYQPANSPPYMAAPSVPYQPQPPSSYVGPGFPVAARPESVSGSNPAAAPKPKFTAKKSSAQALGRSYSLSPPARAPFTGQKSASASASPKPPALASTATPARQTSWREKGRKPLMPWEAASRHPLGLVDEAFAFQDLQQSLATNVRLAAQRKMLPEPPAEWKARVSYGASQKTGSQTWSQSQSRSQSRAPLPSFGSLTRSAVSAPTSHAGYRSLPRQWQPQRSVTQSNPAPSVSSSEIKRPLGKQTYKSVYTSNTWSWRR